MNRRDVAELPCAAILLDPEGGLVAASRQAAELLGFEPTDLGAIEARLESATPWPWACAANRQPIARAQAWRDRSTGRELRVAIAAIGLAQGATLLLLAPERPAKDLQGIFGPLSRQMLSRPAELSFRAVLRHLVQEACELVGAKYGALGVLAPGGAELRDFVFVGITDEQARAIGQLPKGRGLLGTVIREKSTLRVDDIAQDPRRSGFPPKHPPMTSFLGVPLELGAEVFGNFYLAEKRDGGHFTEADERLLERFSDQAALTVAYAREVENAERRVLEAALQSAPAAIAFFPADPTLEPIGNRAALALLGKLERSGESPAIHFILPSGKALAPADFPSRRSLAGETVVNLAARLVDRTTGEATPVLINSAPVQDDDGALLGAIVIYQDVRGAKELEALRNELLAVVAHDLRSPLQAVVLRVEAMLRQATGDEARVPTSVLEGMRRSGKRIARLVDDLLDVSRIEMGHLSVAPQPTDVALVVAMLIKEVDRGSGQVDLEVRGRPPLARVDPARLEQIVANLVDNAIKYSPPGFPVRVIVEEAPDRGVAISVVDRGHGISAEDLPALFVRYFQVTRTLGARSGVGLGLYITKALVDAHHGRIEVESKMGVGTTFRVWLPSA